MRSVRRRGAGRRPVRPRGRLGAGFGLVEVVRVVECVERVELVVAGDLGHRRQAAQRPPEVGVEQVGRGRVQGDDRAPCASYWKCQCAALVVRPACHCSWATQCPSSSSPGVPVRVLEVVAAGPEGQRDDFLERLQGRAVLADGVTALCLLGGQCTFEEDRVGETLDLLHGDAGLGGHLLDGRARADPSLDVLGAQLALGLDLYLSEPRDVAARGRAQLVVGGEAESFAALGVGAHDMRAPGLESDHSKLSHHDLLIAPLAILRGGTVTDP